MTSDLDGSIEQILGKAEPRRVPSASDAAIVQQQVRAEWQQVTRKRRSKKRLLSFAMAASVLVAAFVTFNAFRINGAAETYVAAIDKNVGSVYVLGENSELLASNNLHSIVAGQVLITNENSGVGLTWETGGSLRIDENTRVEFIARDAVFLHSGRIYFDSNVNSAAVGQSSSTESLKISTQHGVVTHVGTQYMTTVDQDSLTVSVRQGEVKITSGSVESNATDGKQLHVQRGGLPTTSNIETYGSYWHWTESVTPSPILEGRSIDEFLKWVGHETGQSVRYQNEEVEQYALDKKFVGTVNGRPSDELRIWMLTDDLDWVSGDGAIVISKSGVQTEE